MVAAISPVELTQTPSDRKQSWLGAIQELERRSEFFRDHQDYELPPKSRYRARRDALARLRARDELGRRLISQTRLFAHGFWAAQAIACGWEDAELFGLDAGLIPHITLERTRGYTIKRFTPGNVCLEDNHANLKIMRRPVTQGVPWWQDPRLIAKSCND